MANRKAAGNARLSATTDSCDPSTVLLKSCKVNLPETEQPADNVVAQKKR